MTLYAEIGRELVQGFERHVAEVGSDAIVTDLFGMISAEEWAEVPALFAARLMKEERKLRARPNAEQLFALFDAANASVKNSPLLLVVDPVAAGIRFARSHGPLVEARRLKGEARAWEMLRATAGVAENLYREYLEGIWTLNDATLRIRRTPPQFGALAKALAANPNVSGLVDEDCVRVRNAALHKDHATYLPDQATIRLSDSKGWTAVVTSADLEAFAERMEAVACFFREIANHFMLRAISDAGVFEVYAQIATAVAAGDANTSHLAAEADARGTAMFEEIFRVLGPSAGLAKEGSE
jgi:hypothetical protein